MDKDFEKVRNIFLSDELDEETRQDNESKLKEWEDSIRENQNFASWESHDITKQIVLQAKSAYKDIGVTLAENRSLNDTQRASLWAKQDAILWLLSIAQKDAKNVLEQIHKEIKVAISAT